LNLIGGFSGMQHDDALGQYSYLILKNVSQNVTLCASEYAKAFECSPIGTLDYCAHIFEHLSEADFRAAIQIAGKCAQASKVGCQLLQCSPEVQIHGDVVLADHIEAVIVHPSLRKADVDTILESLTDRCRASSIYWDELPTHSPDEELDMALQASVELAERVSHFSSREAEDIALAIALSTQSETQREACATEQATSALGYDVSQVVPLAPPSDIGTENVIKVSRGTDVHRLRISWCKDANAGEIYGRIRIAVQEVFGSDLILKYEDEDGDLCTLARATIMDYLSLGMDQPLRKLSAFPMPTPDELANKVGMACLSGSSQAKALPEVGDPEAAAVEHEENGFNKGEVISVQTVALAENDGANLATAEERPDVMVCQLEPEVRQSVNEGPQGRTEHVKEMLEESQSTEGTAAKTYAVTKPPSPKKSPTVYDDEDEVWELVGHPSAD